MNKINNKNKGKGKKEMKKLIAMGIMAAMAAFSCSAKCTTCGEVISDTCAAYDVKLTLKALSLKKQVCKGCGPCGERTTVYYLDNDNRTIKGYAWFCGYSCPQEYNLVLWDPKYKMDKIAPMSADGTALHTLTFDESSMFVYGKKAKHVAVSGEIVTDTATLAIAGVKGSYMKNPTCDDCEVLLKTVSGHVAGNLALPVNSFAITKYTVTGGGSLCAPTEVEIETTDIQVVTCQFCDMCTFESWCASGEELQDAMVPACGTWVMKYNKKISKGSTPIAHLVPDYAL